MSMLTLFDLDELASAPEWLPIYELRLEEMGWSFHPSQTGFVVRADGSGVTKAEWNAYLGAGRCRECGQKCPMNQGGGNDEGGFRVCDPCSLLDGARLIEHRAARCAPKTPTVGAHHDWKAVADCRDCGWEATDRKFDTVVDFVDVSEAEIDAAIAAHAQPRWQSHWGRSHQPDEHAALVAAQGRRRAAYLRSTDTMRAAA